MENIRYIPVGQVRGVEYKTSKITGFIKRNKILLTISVISIALLGVYVSLVLNFIRLISTIR